jgi:protein-disulfide isomerase
MSLPASRLVRSTGLALSLAVGLACDAAPKGTTPEAAAKSAAASQPVAKLGDRTITLAEIDERVKQSLFDEATENGDPSKLFELRTAAIDQTIDEALLDAEVKKRGLPDRDALLAQEEQKAKPVDDAEVKALYDRFKERLGDTKLEDVAPQIRQRLQEQRHAEARTALLASLREAGGAVVLLEPPRIEVAADGPSTGPATAPITIIEFSDYQCPFCKRAEGALKQVLAKYPEQVRLVYRHFPLDGHKDARPAAEASACADEQGKFWEYHQLLFESAPTLDAKKLRQIAEQTKLDVKAFDACLAEGRQKTKVQNDLDAGRVAGVSGTPAFFVNGIPLSGARPLEEFSKVIDSELAKGKKPAQSAPAAKNEG